jgi:hypothetical protein
MKDKLFKKVFIKSEADLPKEDGNYFIGYKNQRTIKVIYYEISGKMLASDPQYWIDMIDWYLVPLDQDVKDQIIEKQNELIEILRLWFDTDDLADDRKVKQLESELQKLREI